MAYTRKLIFSSPLLAWHQLTLDAAHPEWSAEFRVAVSSILLPQSHCFDCQLGHQRFVCDPTTALWLTSDQPYRLRRHWAAQRSALITLQSDFGSVGRAAMPLSAHAALLLWQRRLQAGTFESLQVEEALLTLLRPHRPSETDRSTAIHPAVERAREHLASDPQRADTLSDIAVAAHCSPFHLARAFRKHTGHSLHSYRTHLRMGMALERMHEGEGNLSHIAVDLGYASHSHFGNVFRRHFGLTPRQLRLIR